MPKSKVDVRTLQATIRQRYRENPDDASEVLRVSSGASDLRDPLHVTVQVESVPVKLAAGAHPTVGGVGDVPCSGDILLAALAACQETTLRMVAANMGISLEGVEVLVEADWDPRGTLAMGKDFPIGLTAIRSRTRVTLGAGERAERAERLLRSAEKYCVILNTLTSGVPVETTFAVHRL
jgi:uncharacterized OsmC-like protein